MISVDSLSLLVLLWSCNKKKKIKYEWIIKPPKERKRNKAGAFRKCHELSICQPIILAANTRSGFEHLCINGRYDNDSFLRFFTHLAHWTSVDDVLLNIRLYDDSIYFTRKKLSMKRNCLLCETHCLLQFHRIYCIINTNKSKISIKIEINVVKVDARPSKISFHELLDLR